MAVTKSFVANPLSEIRRMILKRTPRTVSANTTLTETDDLILVDSEEGNITISLPAAASNLGRIYTIVNTGTNSAFADPNASELIDNSSSVELTDQYQHITIQSIGSKWITL